jgi:hypothetical protein
VPKGRFATLTSWSYSVYTQYLKCPFSVCLEKIQKVKIQEPPNPHFIKGNRMHSAADAFIGGTGKAPPITAEMMAVKDDLIRFRKLKARTELDWAFTKVWQPTGWFDGDAWLRIKTDVCADTLKPPTVDILDWKSGRVYPDHRQQRSLYALGGLQLVQIGQLAGGSKDVKLTAQHAYIETGQRATEEFTMKNLAPLKREWLARIAGMMSDTVFKATPSSRVCRYCKFGVSKGGPCGQEKL